MTQGKRWREILLWGALGVIGMVFARTPEGDNSVHAQQPGELKLVARRIVAFKDGYCLFVKDGESPTNEQGEVYTTDVPDAAVLGTFWATPADGRLTAMIAGWEEKPRTATKETHCTNLAEILHANTGASAKCELHDKTLRVGVIREVLTQPTATPLATPLAEAWRLSSLVSQPGAAANSTVSGLSGEYFVLTTEAGDELLPVAQVRSIVIPNMKTSLSREINVKERMKRLTFRFAEPAQRRALSLMYFRPGVRWIPSYRIELSSAEDAKKAVVNLQAEILNEAEDFGEAPLDIVVGVPNFRFRGLPSPFSLEQTLRNALAQAEPTLMGQMRNDFSNAMYGQRSGEFRAPQRAEAAVADAGPLELPEELSAQGAQDLFVYHLPALRLKTGERAAAPIFTAEAPYRDVYTWDLHLTRQDVEAAPSGSGVTSPLTLSKNEVWHQVELTNTTQVPWTTGAAMLLEDGLPLSQELLTYTSPRDVVRVPVTVSVDTRGSYREEEIGRELESLTWNGYHYAKITKKATLALTNHKAIPIEVEITFRFGGKATSASDEGGIQLNAFDASDWANYRGDPAINNSTTVVWKLVLEPGDTFRPSVTYYYFTRH